MSAEKKAHVAAFAFPFTSHPVLLLHLIKKLAAVLPEVHFSYFNTNASNSKACSTVNVHGYDNIRVYDVDDGIPQGRAASDELREIVELFIEAAPGNFRKRLEEVVESDSGRVAKPTCLLTDAFLWFAADMAESMGIPWLVLWPSGLPSIAAHLYTDDIFQRLEEINGELQNPEQTVDFIPGMSAVRFCDLPKEITRKDWSISRLLYGMQSTLKRSTLVLINSFEEIAPEIDLSSKLQSILNIGPYPLPQPAPAAEDDHTGCLSWLSHQQPSSVVYISFGTALMPPAPELVALGEALEEKRIPYLWSYTKGRRHELLERFFERTSSVGKVVRWAPQLQVLSHPSVGVSVTHCGWNSTLESIVGGVPMICRPFFADQMINGRFIEEVWRIGMGVNGGVFTKSGVMEALDVILVKEDGKRMKENIEKLRQRAFMAVAENGSSSRNFKSLATVITSLNN